jgi:lysophospholipase L1-like esterase
MIFGSSIAEGYWAVSGGWVQLLIERVSQHHVDTRAGADRGDWVMNLGVGGDTVSRVAARLPGEAAARTGPHAADLAFVFAVGGNDSMRITGRDLSDPERFAGDLEGLHAVAAGLSQRVMFVGLTPVDPAAELARSLFDAGRLRVFDSVLREVSARAGAPFVPLMDDFQSGLDAGRQLLSFDGVHPSDEGHRLIHDRVRPVLAEWLHDLR